MRRTPAWIFRSTRPLAGSAVLRRSTVSRPRPLLYSRSSAYRARRDAHRVGARVHLHTADRERRARQHEGADRQQRPRRAEPGPAREGADQDRGGERDDHPAEAEHRRHGAGARQGREADQRAAGLGQQHDAALAAAVLALGREDQPRGHVHQHAEAEQDAAEREPQPHGAGGNFPAARQAGADPAEPAAGAGAGDRGGKSFVHRHALSDGRAGFTSRDGPDTISAISRRCVRVFWLPGPEHRHFPEMGTTRRTCSHWSPPARRTPPRTRCARASTRPTRSDTGSRRSSSSSTARRSTCCRSARKVHERVATTRASSSS